MPTRQDQTPPPAGDQPHDHDAERALLGCMLRSARAVEEADTAGARAEWFHLPQHELIYHAVRDLHAHGPVDPTLVVARLMDRRELGRAGGGEYIHRLLDAPLSPANAAHYAAVVREQWIKRSALGAAIRLRQIAHESDPSDLAQVLRRFQGDMDAIAREAEDASRASRGLTLTAASQIGVRPVRWLWDTTPQGAPPTSHGRIPLNCLCIAAGGPGLGKSQFAAWLTARVTTGTLPGELYGTPRAVIYAATEDSWALTIAPRMIAAGAALDWVFRVDVRDDDEPHARLTLPVDVGLLGRAAEQYSAGLVVADPLLSLIDEKIDDYRQKEVRKALEPLAKAADEHRFTVLGLAHFTKSGGADPLARISGSGAFGQVVRCALAFARQDGEDGPEFVMSQVKNNLGRLDVPSFSYAIQPVTVETPEGPSYVSRFVLGPETSLSVAEAMRGEGSGPSAEMLSDVALWLRDMLADQGGSMPLAEIKRAGAKEGYGVDALYRARKKLGLRGEQSGFGAGKVSLWTLPES